MKTFFTMMVVLAPTFFYAQKLNTADVPKAVVAAFSKDYPSVKVEKWEKEGDNYEADFKVKAKEHSAVYDNNGRLIETEQSIAPGELPEAVNQYIEEYYKNTKVKEAAKITSASGSVSYEADLGKQDLLFDSTGGFLGVEKDGDGEDD